MKIIKESRYEDFPEEMTEIKFEGNCLYENSEIKVENLYSKNEYYDINEFDEDIIKQLKEELEKEGYYFFEGAIELFIKNYQYYPQTYWEPEEEDWDIDVSKVEIYNLEIDEEDI